MSRVNVLALLVRDLAWKRRFLAGALVLVASPGVRAGLDHPVTATNSGIWSHQYTQALEIGVIATEVGGALWLGGESELGLTFWQTVDSSIFSSATAQVMKWSFGRKRPSQTSDPNEWFKGGQSFPSGEVTLQASFVTPFIVTYADRNPWVWALEILPAYDAVARVKQGAHWQTDVIAGWALGTGFGYFAAKNKTPYILSVLPHGFMVGMRVDW
ncbi:MAG: phosphatase PAP2 family protein [Terriglobales bacterium]